MSVGRIIVINLDYNMDQIYDNAGDGYLKLPC